MKDFLKLIFAILIIGISGIFISTLLFDYVVTFLVWSALYCAGIGWAFYRYAKRFYIHKSPAGVIVAIATFTVVPLVVYDTKYKNLNSVEEVVIWSVWAMLLTTTGFFAKKKAA